MLVTLKEILPYYLNKKSAIGAFNVTTYADAQPVIVAAEKRNAPVIVQVGSMATNYMDINLWGKLLTEMAHKASVPVCIHLDHARSIEHIQYAIDAGFSSVMIDGSQLPYAENVALTKEVVYRASLKGISVEGEIGSVAYSGTDEFRSELSDPIITAQFVEDTGIDAVAVSVGTLHRMETQGSHINIPLLKSIEEKVNIPLVIHGSSGLLDEEFKAMCATHVCKVNIGTVLRMEFDRGLRQVLADNQTNYVTTELLPVAMSYVEKKVSEKLTLLGFK